VNDGREDGDYGRVRKRVWIDRKEEKGTRGELAVQIVVTPPGCDGSDGGIHLPHR
jgi:hypothetical protein